MQLHKKHSIPRVEACPEYRLWSYCSLSFTEENKNKFDSMVTHSTMSTSVEQRIFTSCTKKLLTTTIGTPRRRYNFSTAPSKFQLGRVFDWGLVRTLYCQLKADNEVNQVRLKNYEGEFPSNLRWLTSSFPLQRNHWSVDTNSWGQGSRNRVEARTDRRRVTSEDGLQMKRINGTVSEHAERLQRRPVQATKSNVGCPRSFQ